MRILCVTPHVPWPLHGGPAVRIYNLVAGLADQGHEVTLLAGSASPEEEPIDELDPIVSETHLYRQEPPPRLLGLLRSLASSLPYPSEKFLSEDYTDELRRLVESQGFDLALVNYTFMLDAAPEDVLADVPVVLDQHESEIELWQDYVQTGDLVERTFARLNLRKVERMVDRAFDRADALVCVSPEEARAASARLPEATPVWTVPNGVDVERYRPGDSRAEEPRIMFCAGMSVERNVRAGTWFANEVFPSVRAEVDDAEFWIVGANPTDDIERLGTRGGIEVTGTVLDVRPYYQDAAVVVAPNRQGGFSKVKMTEAMAMGKAIVASPNGAQGLDVEEGRHCSVRGTAEAFAREVADLLQDPKRRAAMGDAARELAVRRYAWSTVTRELDDRIRKLVSNEEDTV